MIRIAAVLVGLAALTAPALAVDFPEEATGVTVFTMPSGNVGCVFHDEEGAGLVLECDRVEPTYLRVRLFEEGMPRVYSRVGDPSCCGGENEFPYGTSWRKGPFSCASTTMGLRCNNGDHGFRISRSGVKTY